jgi:hypothetical protein
VGGISSLVFNINVPESAAHILPRAILRIGLCRDGEPSVEALWKLVVVSVRMGSNNVVQDGRRVRITTPVSNNALTGLALPVGMLAVAVYCGVQ